MLTLKTCALSQIFSLLSQIFVSSLRFNASCTDIFSSRLPPSLRAQTALCSSLRYARKPVGSACGFFLLSLGLQLDRRLATFPANRTTASERVRLFNPTECACATTPLIRASAETAIYSSFVARFSKVQYLWITQTILN